MAEERCQEVPSTHTLTQTVQASAEPSTSPTLRMKLQKPKNDKKVQWSTETVDNEHMNKKKSKCCCIYEKPKMFDESSSEDDDDDECHNCRGHKKKCYRANDSSDHDHPSDNHGEPDVDGSGAVAT